MIGFVDILGRSFGIEHVWDGCRSVWDVSGLNVVASKTDRSAKGREEHQRRVGISLRGCADWSVFDFAIGCCDGRRLKCQRSTRSLSSTSSMMRVSWVKVSPRLVPYPAISSIGVMTQLPMYVLEGIWSEIRTWSKRRRGCWRRFGVG